MRLPQSSLIRDSSESAPNEGTKTNEENRGREKERGRDIGRQQRIPQREGRGPVICTRKRAKEADDVDLKRGARQLKRRRKREDATPRAATLTHRVYLASLRSQRPNRIAASSLAVSNTSSELCPRDMIRTLGGSVRTLKMNVRENRERRISS